MKFSLFAILIGLTIASQQLRHLVNNPEKLYVGYLASWAEKETTIGADTNLANLPAYVNVVNLAFMLPDAQYSGNLDLTGTGFDFPLNGPVLKDAIDILKQRNPSTKVLVSVGGGLYNNWANLNENAIAQFVKDFGLDGADIDYEPSDPQCTFNNGQVSCATDAEFIAILTRFRTVLPKPYYMSIAPQNVGAYGQGNFVDAQPKWSGCGSTVNPLLSEPGKQLDWINIMAYDVDQPPYNPIEALSAFRSIYSGKITLGVEIPPEGAGTHVLSMSELNEWLDIINDGEGDGVMLWHLNKVPEGEVSENNPNVAMVSQAICKKLDLPSCEKTPISDDSNS